MKYIKPITKSHLQRNSRPNCFTSKLPNIYTIGAILHELLQRQKKKKKGLSPSHFMRPVLNWTS